MNMPYYVFEADGQGRTLGMSLHCRQSQGILSIWNSSNWYYEIYENEFRLTSTLVGGITYTYTRGR